MRLKTSKRVKRSVRFCNLSSILVQIIASKIIQTSSYCLHFCLSVLLNIFPFKKLKFLGYFPFVNLPNIPTPPPPPSVHNAPSVIERVALHSNVLCDNIARAFGGANNMHPLNWGWCFTNGKDPISKREKFSFNSPSRQPLYCQIISVSQKWTFEMTSKFSKLSLKPAHLVKKNSLKAPAAAGFVGGGGTNPPAAAAASRRERGEWWSDRGPAPGGGWGGPVGKAPGCPGEGIRAPGGLTSPTGLNLELMAACWCCCCWRSNESFIAFGGDVKN